MKAHRQAVVNRSYSRLRRYRRRGDDEDVQELAFEDRLRALPHTRIEDQENEERDHVHLHRFVFNAGATSTTPASSRG